MKSSTFSAEYTWPRYTIMRTVLPLLLSAMVSCAIPTNHQADSTKYKEDLAIFDAVLTALPMEKIQTLVERDIRVDPRLFTPTDTFAWPTPDAVLPATDARIAQRRRLIRNHGFGLADAVQDESCRSEIGWDIWVRGEPLPRERCDFGGYTSIAVAAPRRGGSHFPGRPLTEAPAGAKTVRVVAFSSASYHLFDFTLVPTSSGWEVIQIRTYFSFVS